MNPLYPIFEPRFHLHPRFEAPADVIWHLTEEATSVEIEDSINKSNAAMMATSSKFCTNKNCGKRGHTSDQCYEKGGGKEGQAPDWWKKQTTMPCSPLPFLTTRLPLHVPQISIPKLMRF